jgi:hypothetical protein
MDKINIHIHWAELATPALWLMLKHLDSFDANEGKRNDG